jgi:dolichol-phosphate mannosyltransferase
MNSDGARARVTQNFPDLAIVIPTLNERANISILLQRLTRALNGIYWEAIFVDDDSADGTIGETRRIARLDARIRGIRRISRRGPAAAALSYNHPPPSFWLPRGL